MLILRDVTIIVVLCFLISATASSSEIISMDRINKLEECSQEQLGVPLKALKYLLDLNPNDFMLESAIIDSGEMKYIKLLETNGYIQVNRIRSLPNGVEGPFVRLVPTKKTMLLLDYLGKGD